MVLTSELHVVLLLFIVWLSELACKRVNVSPIIGQIGAGLVIGPALLDLFAHVEVFRLLGKLGVMIVVIESGLTVDVRVLRKVGTRAFLVGVTGVILPTVISFALYAGLLDADWKVTPPSTIAGTGRAVYERLYVYIPGTGTYIWRKYV